MDHIVNNRLSLEFGQTYARIPIEKSSHIRNANALEIDWADVLPSSSSCVGLEASPGNPLLVHTEIINAQSRVLTRAAPP